jgi:hypothetical protein
MARAAAAPASADASIIFHPHLAAWAFRPPPGLLLWLGRDTGRVGPDWSSAWAAC